MKKGKMSEEAKAALRLRFAQKVKTPPKILQVTADYRIVGRPVCLTIEKRHVNGKTGGVTWQAVGDHVRLSHAIESISEHVVRDDIDRLLHVAKLLEDIKKVAIQIRDSQ